MTHENADHMTLRAGQMVGRYRLVSILGHGGFGLTYRATDTQLGRDVAIKEYLPAALVVRQDGTTVVPRSKSAAEDFAWGRDRFVAEARTLAALHHAPGIVRVHDFLEANGTAYLVMELINGETMEERLRRVGTLDAAGIDMILRPLLDGLEQVHAAGFLHRDIKPANILLDPAGQPTLVDFGAARAAVIGRSQALTAVFTPAYAAAEQLTAATQGPWTDIYGLAATLHHAITGRAPPNSIDRLLDDSYVPIAGSTRAYPPALLAGIDAGLAVRAADRPQSIAAWRASLTGGDADKAETVVMRHPGAPASATAAPPSSRRFPVGAALAGGSILLLLVAGGAYFALSPRGTSVPAVSTAAAPAAPDVEQRSRQDDLETARLEQRKAAEEMERLRAEVEARRKADEEVALRHKIEDELQRKAEAKAAARQQAELEAKQKADADAAAKLKADQEAKQRAEEEAAARVKSEEQDKAAAEAAEAGLHLSAVDRRRLQVALTSLGFATGGTDGVFGSHSRDMIAAWQRKNGFAATGFLKADQRAALLQTAAAAVSRYDDEQRKLEEEKARQSAVPAPTTTSPSTSPNGAGQCEGTFRSQWCRSAYQGFPANCWSSNMTIRSGTISDNFGVSTDPHLRNVVTGSIDGQGNVSIIYNGVGTQTFVNRHFTAPMKGSVANGTLMASGRAGENGRDFTVRVQCR
ncbi:MAG: protein kinase [Proteobacteria bacterium]|nr:protein kinase [Pseudomonadota bacterium]